MICSAGGGRKPSLNLNRISQNYHIMTAAFCSETTTVLHYTDTSFYNYSYWVAFCQSWAAANTFFIFVQLSE